MSPCNLIGSTNQRLSFDYVCLCFVVLRHFRFCQRRICTYFGVGCDIVDILSTHPPHPKIVLKLKYIIRVYFVFTYLFFKMYIVIFYQYLQVKIILFNIVVLSFFFSNLYFILEFWITNFRTLLSFKTE